jgi:hypothetical protein
MNPDDTEPTAEELEEAESLARALERGHGSQAPTDALETAALLRYAKDAGALDSGRSQSILDDALTRAKPPSRARPWRTLLFGALGLSAAAAAALLVLQAEPKLGPSPLPAPPRALLDSQIQAMARETASLEPLAVELKPYRVAVYSAIREHYGR